MKYSVREDIISKKEAGKKKTEDAQLW